MIMIILIWIYVLEQSASKGFTTVSADVPVGLLIPEQVTSDQNSTFTEWSNAALLEGGPDVNEVR